MELMIDAKTLHDVTGHYNRFDVLSLRYNRKRPRSIELIDEIESSTSTHDIAALVRSALNALESQGEAAGNNAGHITELRGLLAKLSPHS
jgi:hypothetical protein